MRRQVVSERPAGIRSLPQVAEYLSREATCLVTGRLPLVLWRFPNVQNLNYNTKREDLEEEDQRQDERNGGQ